MIPTAASLPPLAAAILIGGRSTRMGTPKALLALDGVTFAKRVLAAIQPHAKHVVLVGEGPIPEPLDPLPRLPDAPSVPGPLGGILAALRSTPARAWLIVAVDLPLVTPEAIEWLISQRLPSAPAVLPIAGDRGVEPLLAVYEPSALPLLESLAAAGSLAPRALADSPGVLTPRVPAAMVRCWTNVNTPEDLRDAMT